MIKSMTGYGKGESAYSGGRIIVELRSVNHRYGEISVKLPRALMPFENEIKKRVAERLSRGKIDVFIQMESAGALGVPTANLPLAGAYYRAFTSISEALGLPGEVSLAMLVSQRDVIAVAAEAEAALEEMPQELLAALEEGINRVDEMRTFEGESLLADFSKRREFLKELIGRVVARAPSVVADYAAKLKERILGAYLGQRAP